MFFCLTALALLLSTTLTTALKAQGVVTLGGEAAKEAANEDPTLQGIPDEVSLFDDDEDKVIPLEAKVVPASKEASVPAAKTAEAPALSNDTPVIPTLIPDSPLIPQQTTSAPAPKAAGVGAFGGRDFTTLDDNIFFNHV